MHVSDKRSCEIGTMENLMPNKCSNLRNLCSSRRPLPSALKYIVNNDISRNNDYKKWW